MATKSLPRFIDIGANLGDPTFRGKPRSRQIHPDDFDSMLERADKAGLVAHIVTGDCLPESRAIVRMAHQNPQHKLFTTAGCHPCRAKEAVRFKGGVVAYIKELETFIEANLSDANGKRCIVAIGECGLDYDRLFLSPKEDQLLVFPPQLELASRFDLPLFLHSRTPEAHKDFVDIIKKHGKPLRGVVHSHTGTLAEALELIEMGFYIGINGCSLKTEENLEMVKALPLSSLMLETDCPWCDIRKSHASYKLLTPLLTNPKFEDLRALYVPPAKKPEQHSKEAMVKGRNEPCTIGQVAWAVSALQKVPLAEVAQAAYENTVKLFNLTL